MSQTEHTCPACAGRQTAQVTAVGGLPVRACAVCRLRFVPPAALAGQVDYDHLYEDLGDYGHHVSDGLRAGQGVLPRLPRARRHALHWLRRRKPGTVLEVGCGVGTFLAWVQRTDGAACYGLDLSARALAIATRHLGCPLHCGPLDDQVFPGVSFDVVCSWEVIEHVPDVAGFLATIHRRLSPGGTLLLSTPNYASRWMWRDMPADPRSRPPVHLTFWNAGALARALETAGFVEVSVRRLSIPLSAARRSGGRWGRYAVLADALLRPSQRMTLLALARRAP